MFYQHENFVLLEQAGIDENGSASVSGTYKPEGESVKDELLSVIEQCGHRLHHRKGGRHGQKRILKILDADSPMTQKDLQKILQIQAGSMSEIIAKLENNGLVKKNRDEHDKRKVVLVITEKGHSKIMEELESEAISNRHLFDSFSDEECEELLRLMSKLLSGLKAEE